MAEPKAVKKPRRKKKAAAEPRSRGITPDAIGSGTMPAAVSRLAESIEADGGSVLAPYKDPLGGRGQVFASLPRLWSSPHGSARLRAKLRRPDVSGVTYGPS